MTTERGPERRPDTSDLVLGLEGAHPEVLVLGELVQDVRCRRDRVAPEEDRQVRELAGGNETPRHRLVATDLGVGARLEDRGFDLVRRFEQLGGLAEVVPGLERERVGCGHDLVLAEPLLDPVERRFDRPGVHPTDDPESEEVLAALSVAGLGPGLLGGLDGEAGHRDFVDRERVEGTVVQRVGGVAGLGQVALFEGVAVDDERAAAREVVDIGVKGRRVHGDKDVEVLPRREDVVVADVDLERAHAGDRARGSADLRREVRQGG